MKRFPMVCLCLSLLCCESSYAAGEWVVIENKPDHQDLVNPATLKHESSHVVYIWHQTTLLSPVKLDNGKLMTAAMAYEGYDCQHGLVQVKKMIGFYADKTQDDLGQLTKWLPVPDQGVARLVFNYVCESNH